MEQKKEIYQDLQRALRVMKYIDDKTPDNKIFYAMWLLENRALTHVNLHVSWQKRLLSW
jgi:hypothetical protein